jgi:hypothetical protein
LSTFGSLFVSKLFVLSHYTDYNGGTFKGVVIMRLAEYDRILEDLLDAADDPTQENHYLQKLLTRHRITADILTDHARQTALLAEIGSGSSPTLGFVGLTGTTALAAGVIALIQLHDAGVILPGTVRLLAMTAGRTNQSISRQFGVGLTGLIIGAAVSPSGVAITTADPATDLVQLTATIAEKHLKQTVPVTAGLFPGDARQPSLATVALGPDNQVSTATYHRFINLYIELFKQYLASMRNEKKAEIW